MLVMVSAMLALGLRFYGVSIEEKINALPVNTTSYMPHIVGDEAVYRISFVLFFFFLTMLGLTLCSNKFHNGFWGVKLAIYVLAIGGSMFIPDYVFNNNGYAWFARVASVLFLVLQIVAMIDFAYNWNNSWREKAEKAEADGGSGKGWLALILAAAGGMFLFTLGGIILLFAFLGEDSLSTFFTTVTLVSCIGMTALQLFGPESDGSLLSSAIVALYCVYLNWSAISSNPNESGSIPINTATSGDNSATMVLGMVVAGFSLAWTCYSSSLSFESVMSSGKASVPVEDAEDKAAVSSSPLLTSGKKAAAGGELRHSGSQDLEDGNRGTGLVRATKPTRAKEDGSADGETLESKERFWIFHLFLATGSVYMAMLFTDWGSGDDMKSGGGGSAAGTKVSIGRSSMWIKVCSEWFTIALYMWTLLAARCCRSRNFD